MGITEKIANARSTNWVTEGLSEAEIKATVELAKISAKIERYRLDMGMTQKEFADYMGVSQSMVSKWESREYNFTINSLIEICDKMDVSFTLSIDKSYTKADYTVLEWDKDCMTRQSHKNISLKNWTDREAIA